MTAQEKLKQLESKLPDIWLWFTYVLICLGALAVVIYFFVSIYHLVEDDDKPFLPFLYSLVSFVGLLIPCAIIQMLVKIEKNTRQDKPQQTNSNEA